jgi:hypothetical protein
MAVIEEPAAPDPRCPNQLNWWVNAPDNNWQLATAFTEQLCASCGSDIPPGNLVAAHMCETRPDWIPDGWLCMTCVPFIVRLGEAHENLDAHLRYCAEDRVTALIAKYGQAAVDDLVAKYTQPTEAVAPPQPPPAPSRMTVDDLCAPPAIPEPPKRKPAHRKPKGTPTVYGGVEFRSRLEARWACFFDQMEWQYPYEPFDGNSYIPDFLLSAPLPVLVEVKPAVTEADYRAAVPKMTAGLLGHWDGGLLIVGADPLPAWDRDLGKCLPMGLFGDPLVDGERLVDWDFEVFTWPDWKTQKIKSVRAAWANACNETKWRPKP